MELIALCIHKSIHTHTYVRRKFLVLRGQTLIHANDLFAKNLQTSLCTNKFISK